MTRSHITVRAAEESDLADVIALWAELKHCGALSPRLAAIADDRRIEDQVRRMILRPACRVLLASMSSEVAGMAMLSLVPLGALSDTLCLQVEYTVVKEKFRRRGVGRALMAAAAAYAEEVGAEQVTVSVSPLSREANRFFAQLGLTPLAVRRVAPAGALRRRIATLERPVGAAARPMTRRSTSARTGVREALRRIAIAGAVTEQPHDA